MHLKNALTEVYGFQVFPADQCHLKLSESVQDCKVIWQFYERRKHPKGREVPQHAVSDPY
ncbi:hypothetical protein CHS0354_003837 [Potamilus streckersoni]|uniref:Uncharacterized protein n=1 Tax=Potamilus streckersoni TaxID=2493646 RepID=A0AAE0SFY3_9BIVA|nr:hypothetical protein CHS0354_003837 [Potamilus streckersoni]